jgi:KUP system potassium uptake protein
MSSAVQAAERQHSVDSGLMSMTIAALGVVFGDIGTSPLYTLKTVLALGREAITPFSVLGSLSLILWTLIIITTIKYVNVAMRIDNDGEGGILALMSLIGIKKKTRPTIVAIGLFGAALIYGDGAITPAISVLSALEGLNIVAPHFQPYILPVASVILLGLFLFQSKGTAKIGRAFGPIMCVWFLTIGILGLWGLIQHPQVLAALNPMHGLHYLFTSGAAGFVVLGSVFLCVTGAEALYADMGHFGAKPIRFAWSWLVFPSLLLNYMGQSAIVLEGAPITDNIFYRLCPQPFLMPLVILATVATIIASQSIITSAFSMTRQAIQLGWLPRLKITQTSEEGFGQIYVGAVNWLLMAATLGLTLGFGKSEHLASAYGIAVSATMLATSFLLFIAMREIWNWSLWKAGLLAGFFMIVDAAFFTSNLSKIHEGGYIPVLFAVLVYSVMFIWHKGTQTLTMRMKDFTIPMDEFLLKIEKHKIARVPGTAVFFTRTHHDDAPPVMVWHVKQNRSLHEEVFILKIKTLSKPWVSESERLEMRQIKPKLWRAIAYYGFMESPNIPAILNKAANEGCDISLQDVTYYVGHETLVPHPERKRFGRLFALLFAFMRRNAYRWIEYMNLPLDSVVEIGREVSI